ncbi:uncharacterized protein LOC135374011 [Ornithodoros turicata]|uniref:uncharacterized protein LOC135374011 n=1 Tax=Ornithodoros turicata TaxID=34597 RepID=UPI003139B0DB
MKQVILALVSLCFFDLIAPQCEKENMAQIISEADAECNAKYRQQYGLTTGKHADLVSDTTRCCMLTYGKDCVPLRLREKRCDQLIFTHFKEMRSKQIVAECASLNFNCPLAATCDSTTISEANIDCYKRFETEHGISRKPTDPIEPIGNITLLCSMLKYNKYCVPKLLEDKGCHPAAAIQAAMEIETRLQNCPTFNPIFVPPPQCTQGLPDAKFICDFRYKKEHGTIAPNRRADLQPRDSGRDKVHKKRCCLLQYSKDCVPKILQKEYLCSDPGFLEMFFEQIRTECGTSKWNCTGVPAPQCDDEQLSNAMKICEYKYAEEHGNLAPKRRADSQPRDLSPDQVHKLHCCQMEYNKVCVPRFLKHYGCSDPDFIEMFLEQVRAECGTSKWDCLQCNQKTISDAEDVCLRKYEQEHGIISRGLMSGNDKRLCCTLDYKKNCVPDQLKAKGCGEQLLQNYVAKIQREMTNQCPASNSICTVCPQGLLDSAKSTCYSNYQQDKTASQLHCCVMEYSKTCVPELLARRGCDEAVLLQRFFKDINADCGTSKPVCLECNQKATSDAEDVCLRKYEQEHGIISRGLMSGNGKRLCCMLDYKKNCVPDQLKPKGCGEQLLQNYVAKMQSEMRYQCAASNSMCAICPTGLLGSAKSTCNNNYQKLQDASKLHCCVMEYSKTCVPEILERQRCDETFLLERFFKDINADCGTSKPVCDFASKCPNKTLSPAQTGCEESFIKERGLVLPPEYVNKEANKWYCCMMQYSQNCLQDTLKKEGCDSEDFLQGFTRKVETQCGTSKSFCSAQCNKNTLSHAQSSCNDRYMQTHVLNPEKPEALSPNTQKHHCCMMEYSKTCLPELLKQQGCDDTGFVQLFIQQTYKIYRQCGTFKLDCVPVPKCDPKTVPNAENDCATKYKQLYGLTTRKPDEKQKPAGLSPEIDKQWCCSMEYSKNCVTEVLKDKRCGDEISASFLEQKKKVMANMCGTSKLDCEFDKSKSAGCMKYPAWTLAAAVIVASVMKIV